MTWKLCGLVRWQHLMKPSHTLGYFHTCGAGGGHQGKAREATTFPRALPWLGAQVPPLDRIFLASYTHLPRNLPFLT